VRQRKFVLAFVRRAVAGADLRRRCSICLGRHRKANQTVVKGVDQDLGADNGVKTLRLLETIEMHCRTSERLGHESMPAERLWRAFVGDRGGA
jgi:hypothetical protein